MGLDMYLSARRYVSGYSFGGRNDDDPSVKAYKSIMAGEVAGIEPPPFVHEDASSSIYVEYPAMYWRKANQIHSWFVSNVQDGNDDCGNYNVSREKIVELDELCRNVFMSQKADYALEHLPPGEGFFFGNTSIDEWYWEQVRTTMDFTAGWLAAVPETDYTFELVYHSSW